MLTGTRAIIYINHDQPHPDKQEALTLRHAEAVGLHVVALCANPAACAAVVRSGGAAVVVVAVEDPGLDELVRAAGGRVEVARPAAAPGRVRRGLVGIVQRMVCRGMDTGDIAEILDVDTGEIRRIRRTLDKRRRPGRRGDRGGAMMGWSPGL